jgi:hypothetical protein
MGRFCIPTFAQYQVTKIEINTVPADGRIRPFENVVVQLVVHADVTDKNGSKKNERIKRRADSFEIKDKDGGWLSKPFFYQGIEGIASVLENRLSGLLGTFEEFVVQDSVLYTAPDKPGKYTIKATLGDKQARTVIQVDPKAPSYRKPERTDFQPEPARKDPYGPLAGTTPLDRSGNLVYPEGRLSGAV